MLFYGGQSLFIFECINIVLLNDQETSLQGLAVGKIAFNGRGLYLLGFVYKLTGWGKTDMNSV